jgi:hypothetical protein
MARFARQQETALKLISLNGEDVVWRKLSTTPAPGAKPWDQSPSSLVQEDYTVKMVFLPFNQKDLGYKTESWSKHQQESTIGLVEVLMPKVTFRPSITDVVIRRDPETGLDKLYSVLTMDTLAPNGEIIMYTIVLKE